MKRTFKSDEIAHVWAHAGAPEGKCPAAMSFHGDAFYSYSTEICRRIRRNESVAYVLNVSGYSSTTSQHSGLVQAAIRGETVLYIGGQGRGARLDEVKPSDLFDYAMTRAAALEWSQRKRVRNVDGYKAEAARWMERAQKVAEFFGLRRKVDEDQLRKLQAAKARNAARAERERLAREEKDRAQYRQAFEDWKANRPNKYFPVGSFPVAFRLEGAELVSSRGARVPIREAKVALRFILSHRGQTWRANGETCPVGMYRVDSITPEGIVAGCHRIDWSEIERVQTLLA